MTGTLLVLVIGALAMLTLAATGVRAVSRLWLRHWIEHRAGGSAVMARYLERPARLVHAAGTASMLLVFASGALLVIGTGSLWRSAGEGVIWSIGALLLGQLLPRAVGRRWAPQLVPVTVPFLRIVDVVLAPVRVVAAVLTARLRSAPPADPEQEARDGLEELLRDENFLDIGATEEMAIISGVVQFGDKTVADVMTPRSDLFMLTDSLTPMQMAEQMAQAGYSRVPVLREATGEVSGMVHVFDVFRRAGESMPAVRPITFTTLDRPAKELLFALLRSRRQMAIVREGELVVGVVTLEDLLEELVGDIRDEHDEGSEDGSVG